MISNELIIYDFILSASIRPREIKGVPIITIIINTQPIEVNPAISIVYPIITGPAAPPIVEKAGCAAAKLPVGSNFAIPPRKKGVSIIGIIPQRGTTIKNTRAEVTFARIIPVTKRTAIKRRQGKRLPNLCPINPANNGPKIVKRPPAIKT